MGNVKSDTKVRIWSSKKNDDDYMLLLFLCNFLKDQTNKISVIFSSDYKGVWSINALDYKKIETLEKEDFEVNAKNLLLN